MKRLDMRRREALTGLAYAAPPLLGLTVFFAAPFAISIVKTFFNTGGAFIGLTNYMSLFESDAFRLAMGNTLRFIGVGVPVILSLSLAVALALWGKVKGKRLFRTLFVIPLVVPVSSVILAFNIFFERSGIFNTMFEAIGLGKVDYLRSGHAFGVLLVLYVWKNCGYSIVLFLAGLSQIPAEYYEAARVDGAGRLRMLRSITIPLLVPTFFFTFVISIVNSFKSFREAYALGGAYPHESIYMLQHFMNNNFYNLNYSRLSVASLLTFSVIIMLVFLLFWLRRKEGENQ